MTPAARLVEQVLSGIPTNADGTLYSVADVRKMLERFATDSLRYKWLANKALYCDYGDNGEEAGVIGYGIVASLRDGEQFMYGPSIDAAIDAALCEPKK